MRYENVEIFDQHLDPHISSAGATDAVKCILAVRSSNHVTSTEAPSGEETPTLSRTNSPRLDPDYRAAIKQT